MWRVVCIFAVLKCVNDFESFILNIFRKHMNIHVQVHMAFLKLKEHANNI